MPSVAQETAAPSSKKRRRDDDAVNRSADTAFPDLQIPLYTNLPPKQPMFAPGILANDGTCPSLHDGQPFFATRPCEHGTDLYHQPSLPQKMIPLPSSKRQRTTADSDDLFASKSICVSPAGQRHPRSSAATLLDDPLQQKLAHARTAPTRVSSAVQMARCHICFRKPTKKLDLDSFADCQGCGQRTCYICIRQCSGWHPGVHDQPPHSEPRQLHDGLDSTDSLATTRSFAMLDAEDETAMNGVHSEHQGGRNQQPLPDQGTSRNSSGWRSQGHQKMICSRCCVERGEDGDVVCLGCLPFVEG